MTPSLPSRPQRMRAGKRAVVVGAGIAGLTAAARLAYAGYETTIFEKGDRVGGRAAQATWEGFIFDLGPTLLFFLSRSPALPAASPPSSPPSWDRAAA